MECFFVDGKKQSFADVILKYKKSGDTCLVGSFGFGTKQVKKLLANFKKTVLLADASHSQLNSNAYLQVCKLAENSDDFIFKKTKTHAKFAIIDEEIFIFTSANLSMNHRLEIYMAGNIGEVEGIEEVKRIMDAPEIIIKEKDKQESSFNLDLDFNIDLDFSIENIEV